MGFLSPGEGADADEKGDDPDGGEKEGGKEDCDEEEGNQNDDQQLDDEHDMHLMRRCARTCGRRYTALHSGQTL